MTCDLSYDRDDGIVIVRVTGNMGIKELEKVAADTMDFVRKYNCHLALGDLRDCNPIMSIVELYYYRTRILAEELRHLRRALVFSRLSEVTGFFANVSVNHGQQVRVFTDIDMAHAWLKSAQTE